MPKANEAQLEQDDAVDVSRVDGKLGVSPLSTSGVTLEHFWKVSPNKVCTAQLRQGMNPLAP